MMKNKTTIILILIVTLSISMTSCRKVGQKLVTTAALSFASGFMRGFTQTQYSSSSKDICIKNNFGNTVRFGLSCDNVNWGNNQLNSGQNHCYKCDSGTLYIRIVTTDSNSGAETGRVEYRLESGKKYDIGYNQTSGKFDVFPTVSS